MRAKASSDTATPVRGRPSWLAAVFPTVLEIGPTRTSGGVPGEIQIYTRDGNRWVIGRDIFHCAFRFMQPLQAVGIDIEEAGAFLAAGRHLVSPITSAEIRRS